MFRSGKFSPVSGTDCVNYMLGVIVDGFDGNDPTGNPANYKGGGYYVDGAADIVYYVFPQKTRPPARDGVTGGCRSYAIDTSTNRFEIWGHGFETNDWGVWVKLFTQQCKMDTWSFNCGLGGDSREWTAFSETTWSYQEKCVSEGLTNVPGVPPGIKCVTHEGVGAPYSPGDITPRATHYQKVCNNVYTDKYVSRDALYDAVVNEFCPTSAGPGDLDLLPNNTYSITRRYYENTLDDVVVSIHFSAVTWIYIPQDECERYFLEIIDGCDGNDPDNNPANYKGGGYYTNTDSLGTDRTFQIQPLAFRQPASDGFWGKCDCEETKDKSGEDVNVITLTGHGFQSNDFGGELYGHLIIDNCSVGDWSFSYGLGTAPDMREWTTRFSTYAHRRLCVQGAMKKFEGSPQNIVCIGCAH